MSPLDERVRPAEPLAPRPAEVAGRRVVLLDELGRDARTLRSGTGLVAATAQEGQQPTWLVTGTDDVGVAAAAAALQEDRLRDRFALAIEAGQGIPLPVDGPGAES